jgi:hypothetical protein
MLRISFAACLTGMMALAATTSSSPVTFNKDILPILQKNCQTCHRPGEDVPMPLLSYDQARPWAKAIKTAVITRKMPPWFADPTIGHFQNDRTLSAADVNTLAAWADNGAPEGNSKDRPAPLTFHEGWNINPDVVIEMPNDFKVPARGTVDYQYILVKGNFTEDVWVRESEMRAGNPKLVHHMKAWIRPLGSSWMQDAVPGVPYASADLKRNDLSEGNDIVGKYNPGLGAQAFDVSGSAKLVPKGSDVVFEVHYTANGEAGADRSKIGLVLAKEPPASRYFTSFGPNALNLVIAPGDNHAEVVSEVTVGVEAKLVEMQPHMHLRGKDYEVRVIYPSGELETIFKAKFDFNWQLGYELAKPILLPKGTRVIGIAHFDNSPNNLFNPDPEKMIRWGLQNWDEMSNCFMGLIVDIKTKPADVFHASGPSLLPASQPGPTLAACRDCTR